MRFVRVINFFFFFFFGFRVIIFLSYQFKITHLSINIMYLRTTDTVKSVMRLIPKK